MLLVALELRDAVLLVSEDLRHHAQDLDIIAAELERLRILKEHELGVRVEYEEGDPCVSVREE